MSKIYVVDLIICYPDYTWGIMREEVEMDSSEYSDGEDAFQKELFFKANDRFEEKNTQPISYIGIYFFKEKEND